MFKIPEKFLETVFFLAKTLGGYQYAFRGTTSLVLQGIKMNVDDIDILCDKKTAGACNSLFCDFVREEVSYKDKESPKFKSFFGRFWVNGILVEVMGEWQIKDAKGNWSEPFNASCGEKREIEVDGQKVYVTAPETELLMFSKMERWQVYHRIKRQMESQGNEGEQQNLFWGEDKLKDGREV